MLKISNHYVSKIVFFLLFVEVLVLVGAAYAGAAVRFMDLGRGRPQCRASTISSLSAARVRRGDRVLA